MAKSALERREAEEAVKLWPYGHADIGEWPRFRTAYGPRLRVDFECVGESMTKQSFRDECDVNLIMKRYAATGVLPGAERVAGARYLDCTAADYQQAMLVVASAKSAFLEMPAAVRDRFGNDPSLLMRFLEDPRNVEEARELGLVNPEAKEATPLAVRVVESPVGDPGKALSRIESGLRPAGPAANAPAGSEPKA